MLNNSALSYTPTMAKFTLGLDRGLTNRQAVVGGHQCRPPRRPFPITSVCSFVVTRDLLSPGTIANIHQGTLYGWLKAGHITERCFLHLDGHHLKIRLRAWCDWLERYSERGTDHTAEPKSTL